MRVGPRAAYPDPIPVSNSEGAGEGLLQYLKLVMRHKVLVGLCGMVGALLGYLTVLPQYPVYQAKTFLEVQEPNQQFLNLRELDPVAGLMTADAFVETQSRILQSKSIRERTTAELVKNGVASWRPTRDRLSTLLERVGLPSVRPASDFQSAVAMAAQTTAVRRVNNTRLLEISADSTDPVVGARFVNGLVHQFEVFARESRLSTSRQTSDWLTGQLDELRRELARLEDRLQTAARSFTVVPGNEGDMVGADKLRQLQQELSTATARRIEAESRHTVMLAEKAEVMPEVLADSAVRNYEQKLTDMRTQLIELSSTLTPEHYKVKRLAEQISEIEKTVERERNKLQAKVTGDLQSARLREQMLLDNYEKQSKVVGDRSANLVQFNVIKREVESTRQLYESMLQRVKEAGLNVARETVPLRVLDPAVPAKRPYRPDGLQNVLAGLGLGLFGGVLAAIARSQMDRSVRNPGETAAMFNVPELGAVISAQVIPAPAGTGPATQLLGAPVSENGNESYAATMMDYSPQAESFRAVLTSLLSMEKARSLVFTSPNPSDGKTTVISNLALALAEIDRKVVLIDADLREPRLHTIFEVAGNWGLTSILSETQGIAGRPLETLVRPTRVPNLSLIPAGPAAANISRLMYSARFEELLERLGEEVDIVLIDSPPMLQISDARILALKADGAVLVLRSGVTSRDDARTAIQRLTDDGTPIIGTVLNDWKPGGGDKNHYHYRSKYTGAL